VNGQQPFDASGAFFQTPLPRSAAMDTTQFWDLIESARSVTDDPADSADSDLVTSEVI
jgi:hypothetical protein